MKIVFTHPHQLGVGAGRSDARIEKLLRRGVT